MSKLETPMTRAYWQRMGGTLLEEYPIIKRTKSCGARYLDAIILPKGEFRIAKWKEISLEGKDIIIVQSKANRLGMSLMGQALFSIELVKPYRPASIRSIALCLKDDEVLRSFLKPFPNIEVVILSRDEICSSDKLIHA